ncbi:MAG: hypothetical protein ACREE1_16020, partial [Stellaceae bacterium]
MNLDQNEFNRRCRINGEDPLDDLHETYWKSLVAYEQALKEKHNGKRVRAAYTWRQIGSKGVRKILEAHSLSRKPSQGFLLQVEHHPEMTDEYLVIKFQKQFSPLTVEAAKSRLQKYNVSLPRSAEHNRSMEEEARDILRCTLSQEPEPRDNLADGIRRIIEPLGGVELPSF